MIIILPLSQLLLWTTAPSLYIDQCQVLTDGTSEKPCGTPSCVDDARLLFKIPFNEYMENPANQLNILFICKEEDRQENNYISDMGIMFYFQRHLFPMT